jgi:hypothetical protein
VLKLEPPSEHDGLPRVVGEPEYVVATEGTWHVHNGGWSPDSKRLVYTRDMGYGDIYELVERRLKSASYRTRLGQALEMPHLTASGGYRLRGSFSLGFPS